MDLPLATVLLLALASFCAGAIDAIAGGGGLITLPALLAAGLSPQVALGTNKGQSVFGGAAALARYARSGLVNRAQAAFTFPAGLVGSFCGAAAVLALEPAVVRPLVLVLLVASGAVVAFRRPPRPGQLPVARPDRARAIALGIALVLGAYDGFFGPGTGTFLMLAFVGLLGETVPRATADAKVVNFASNLAAVVMFAARGTVLWALVPPMAIANFLGGLIGAHLAVRGGEKMIRKVVLGVVLALVLKVGWDLMREGEGLTLGQNLPITTGAAAPRPTDETDPWQ